MASTYFLNATTLFSDHLVSALRVGHITIPATEEAKKQTRNKQLRVTETKYFTNIQKQATEPLCSCKELAEPFDPRIGYVFNWKKQTKQKTNKKHHNEHTSM